MGRLQALVTAVAILCAGCSGKSPSDPSTGGGTEITSLVINGIGQFDLIGQKRTLEVIAFRANGSWTGVNASATWQTSNSAAVTISPSGEATAVDVGPAVISAAYQGFNASLAMRVGAFIDCDSYLPTDLSILAEGGEFTIVRPFGGGLALIAWFATAADAAAGLAVFQRYRNHCFVGRNNARTPRLDYIFGYWLNQFGLNTTIDNEDCEPYDKSSVTVVDRGSTGWAVMASGSQLLLLDTAADATTMASMIRTYSNQCYIGRGNTRPNPAAYIHEYWK